MDKKEFIRIVRELQKLQIKLLKSSNMSISTGFNNNSVNSGDYTFLYFSLPMMNIIQLKM